MSFVFFKKSIKKSPGRVVSRADFEKIAKPGLSFEVSNLAFGQDETSQLNQPGIALFLQKTALSKAAGNYSAYKPTKNRSGVMNASSAIYGGLRNVQRQQFYNIPDWATVSGNLHPTASGLEKLVAAGVDAIAHPLLATMPRSYWNSVMEPQYAQDKKGRLHIARDANGKEIRKFNPYNFIIQMAVGMFNLEYLFGEQIDPLTGLSRHPAQNQIIRRENQENNEVNLRQRNAKNTLSQKNEMPEKDSFGRNRYDPEGEGEATPTWRAVYHNRSHYMDAAFINGEWQHAPAGEKTGGRQELPVPPIARGERKKIVTDSPIIEGKLREPIDRGPKIIQNPAARVASPEPSTRFFDSSNLPPDDADRFLDEY